MKLKILVLVGVLAIGLPMVLLAQVPTGNGDQVPTGNGDQVPTGNGGGDSTCLFTLDNPTVSSLASAISCLQSKITRLENRVKVLESANVNIKASVETSASTMSAVSPSETKAIQSFLKEEGSFNYPTATGFYGTVTKEAVKKFQAKQGLTATGLVDKKTLEKMQILVPSVAPSMSTFLQQITL